MSDFQSYPDDAVSGIWITETAEDKDYGEYEKYEEYAIFEKIRSQISSLRSSAEMT